MNLDVFKQMESDQLLSYLEFLLKNYRIVDSFWFIAVEKKFGRPAAEKLNEVVWERAGLLAVRDLKKRFDIREKGLAGLYKVLKLFPWTNIGGHQLEKRENEVILSVPRCPPQVARLKRGLGEYDCKEMHRKEFVQTALEIDPLIKVDCDFAPPDPHPDELFCRWRFVL